MSSQRAPSSAVTAFVVASRYMPVYIAMGVLVVVAWLWAPETLGSVPLRAIAPLAAVLAIAALGQMLVIMTGGIDLSVPGTMSLAAVIMVGVGGQSDERVVTAILIALGAAAIVGLVNGILIGGLKLNPLIVTLAVGQIATGAVFRYGRTFPVQNPVPVGWSEWVTTRILGVSAVFWIGLALTIVLSLGLRYTTVGRRFQAVGANPVASHAMGVRVNVNQILAYVVAAVFYASAALALAGLIRRPGAFVGTQYLLAPIAAVVIGGASLTGGQASALSTFVAAIFLTGLNQMMRIMGLPTALQFVVFGLVIIGGMLVSGDRIIRSVEFALRHRRRPELPLVQTADGSVDRTEKGGG
ncbi:MAG: ABC transporter permease [Actinobacteria bacterium]|nr:ABC transporter permease [Actinomycetota bacterium]